MIPLTAAPKRILIFDDSPAIHEDFRKVLLDGDASAGSLDAAAAAFFGDSPRSQPSLNLRLDFALQGSEGIAMVGDSLRGGDPYSVAFVDMRMPPGLDGLETIQGIWRLDPNIEVVICTAYSDRSWGEILGSLGLTARLLILKKPFDQLNAGNSRKTGGIGMGLTLARQLLGLMNASFSIESTPGSGSRFSFRIRNPAPLAEAA